MKTCMVAKVELLAFLNFPLFLERYIVHCASIKYTKVKFQEIVMFGKIVVFDTKNTHSKFEN